MEGRLTINLVTMMPSDGPRASPPPLRGHGSWKRGKNSLDLETGNIELYWIVLLVKSRSF
jgi:hypothetical protein